MNKNQWMSALITQSIALGTIILSDLSIWLTNNSGYKVRVEDIIGFLILLILPFFLLSIGLTATLHYECWKLLPSGYRQTTPEKAVGFLFIPCYNFYWFFISYPCLASGYYRYGKNNNVNEIHDQRGLAITYAILSICNTFFILVPLIRSITYIAAFVIFVLFYQRMVSYANLVSNMQSKIDS